MPGAPLQRFPGRVYESSWAPQRARRRRRRFPGQRHHAMGGFGGPGRFGGVCSRRSASAWDQSCVLSVGKAGWKKTGMGDVPTAGTATSVEYGIIFSGNKSTLMRLFCRDARCEQHKMSCSHCFLCYFDGDERDAQALYGLRSRSLRLFPSRHIIPPLCRKQTCFLQPLEVSQALHSGVSLCYSGTD